MTSIPAYPASRPIALEDRGIFERIFAARPPVTSEFTFTNLYAWRRVYDFRVSVLEGFLLLSSRAHGAEKFFMPLGEGEAKAVIEKVAAGPGTSFIRLPEALKELFEGDPRFTVAEDRDNADYLYLTRELVALTGRKFDGKRNLIKKFKAAYAYEYLKLDASCVGLCLEFQERWCTIKDCDSQEGLRNERLAIGEMIENFAQFSLVAGAIKTGNDISAVAIAQKLNPDTLVMHVLKADPNIPGLYQAMNNEFLAREGAPFTYVNLEQDLGAEGLRKAKLSYHPLKLVMKYTVTRN